MYDNHNSRHKEHCRKLILSCVTKLQIQNKLSYGGDKAISTLTLPSTNFLLEGRLLQLKNMNLTCVERDKEVFKEQLQTNEYKYIQKYYLDRFVLHRADIFDFAKISNQTYDLIWFDLCGSLQNTIVNRLLEFIQTAKFANTAYFALTVMGSREFYAKEMQEFYDTVDHKDFRENYFPELLNHFAQFSMRTCKLEYIYKYKSELKAKSVPMIFQIYKINQLI